MFDGNYIAVYFFYICVWWSLCVCVGLLVDDDNKQYIHTILLFL